MTEPLLQVEKVDVSYGSAAILHAVSLTVEPGEMVAIIGSNGAGKSTLLKTIVGLVRQKSGKIVFADKDVSKIPAHKRCGLGIALVPEGRQLFTSLSVYDNLLLGAYGCSVGESKEDFARRLESVFSLFPALKKRQGQISGSLSGGEQQMLAIGRALMSKPKVLLCDELSLGLAPMLVKSIYSVLYDLRQQQGITLVVVEQQASLILGIAQRAYVLETGRMVLSGRAEELLGSELIKKSYLGEL